MQDRQTAANRLAWNTKAYEAWNAHFGSPSEEAARILQDPRHPLRRWLKYTGDPRGQRVINLLGSTGRKAIALAMLGAEVTIVDISVENRRYALEVAEAAGVSIDYINADVLNIPHEEKLRGFDILLMEFGILHYFSDLEPVFALVARMLKPGGRYILTDFHPVATKLLTETSTGMALQPEADYYHSELIAGDLSYTGFLPEDERDRLPKVLVRKWRVGEILTALANQGLCLRSFEEEPNMNYRGFPAFYTLVADKIAAELPPLMR